MRSNLSDSYTQIFETTTAGAIDGNSSGNGMPIQLGKWVQFKIELQTISGATRTYTRLKELRFR
jgi:hypothetical protein